LKVYATAFDIPHAGDQVEYEHGVIAALVHSRDPDNNAHLRVDWWPTLVFLADNFPVMYDKSVIVSLGSATTHALEPRRPSGLSTVDFLRGYTHGILASDWGMQDLGTVYAYTYPHYLRHPCEKDTGRTLIKIGSTHRSAAARVRAQTRLTPCPEVGVLLRSWPTRRMLTMERLMHAILEAAGDTRSTAHPGSEWFMTRLDRLDHAAELMTLRAVP
jgi:hypothetical protein